MAISIALRGRAAEGLYATVDECDYQWLSRFNWHISSRGYARRHREVEGVGWRGIVMHREILGLAHGDERVGDHINGNRLDNRRCNLRLATRQQNCQNETRLKATNKSGYRGVAWDAERGKWMATGTLNGRHKTLGRYDDPEEAAAVAAAWRAQHMPFSAEAR